MSGSNDLVSVNLTTFNRCLLLRRSLKSVLKQRYKNMEIVVVDDGSTDDTQNVVRSFMRLDKRVKYFRHSKNLGNAFARNTALENSTGKYLAFMDDDDEWIDPEKIGKQVNEFKKSAEDLAIVCTSFEKIDQYGKMIRVRVTPPESLRKLLLRGNGLICSPTVMTKRDTAIRVGGFDIQLPRGIDSEYYRTCAIKYNYSVKFLPDFTCRVYEGSWARLSWDNDSKSLINIIKAHFRIIRKYFFELVIEPEILLFRLRMILMAFIKMLFLPLVLKLREKNDH